MPRLNLRSMRQDRDTARRAVDNVAFISRLQKWWRAILARRVADDLATRRAMTIGLDLNRAPGPLSSVASSGATSPLSRLVMCSDEGVATPMQADWLRQHEAAATIQKASSVSDLC